MQKENSQTSVLDEELMNLFQDIQAQDHHCFQKFFEFRDNDILNDLNIQENYRRQKSPQKVRQNTFLCEKQSPITLKSFNQDQVQSNDNSSQSQRQNSSQTPKKPISQKQSSYSKAYRQRVKQKYKNLEDQNNYLKKRIKDLQGQLRYQQIQLCKLKLAASNKQIIEEDLSKQYVQQVDRMFKQLKIEPIKLQQRQQMKHVYKQMIIDFHTERGFAGKRKFEILNYHFNELLQGLLKDSQKYISLVYANSKSHDKLQPLPDFDPINKAYLEAFKPGCKVWSRLKSMSKLLQPMSLQINKLISQFHKKYEEILSYCKKIHKFMEEIYLKNMDINFGILKSRVEEFFDFHKYGKMMRRLRYEWFEWMKSLTEKNEQQTKQVKTGYKKKKMAE